MLATDALLRMHAGAMNGNDPDSVLAHYHAGARCIRDGCLVAEGTEGVRRALLEEFAASEDVVSRVMELDGEPVLVEWGGPEGRGEPRAILRLERHGDRVTEVRIDHGSAVRRMANLRPPA